MSQLQPLKINLPNLPERLIGEYMDWLLSEPRVRVMSEMAIVVEMFEDSSLTTTARYQYQTKFNEELIIGPEHLDKLTIAAEMVRSQINGTQDVRTIDYKLYVRELFEIINIALRKPRRAPLQDVIYNVGHEHNSLEAAEDELFGISRLDFFLFGYVDSETCRVHAFYEDAHPHLPVMGNQKRVKVSGRFSQYSPIV